MTANDLINILTDGIRKGTISACSPVLMPDGLDTFVVLDNQTDTVYITDVDPNGEEARADSEYFRSGTRYPGQ